MELSTLQNGIAFSDHSHGAFVKIAKRLGRPLAGKLTPNQFSSVASLLHRNLCHASQRFSVLIKRRRVADHKNFRTIWNSKIGLNTNATGAIGLHPQPFSSGGRCNTGRPDHCPARNSLPGDNDSFAVDLFDGVAQVGFNSELLKMKFRSIRLSW